MLAHERGFNKHRPSAPSHLLLHTPNFPRFCGLNKSAFRPKDLEQQERLIRNALCMDFVDSDPRKKTRQFFYRDFTPTPADTLLLHTYLSGSIRSECSGWLERKLHFLNENATTIRPYGNAAV